MKPTYRPRQRSALRERQAQRAALNRPKLTVKDPALVDYVEPLPEPPRTPTVKEVAAPNARYIVVRQVRCDGAIKHVYVAGTPSFERAAILCSFHADRAVVLCGSRIVFNNYKDIPIEMRAG